ncbi:MAG: hypothetical protein ACREMO_02100 [Gemmatimonadales bacterium]
MLTTLDLQRQRRRRATPSLKQQYQEYILQRIEGYKNSLAREELLRIGDEAVAELDATIEGQFLLTEVLMQDTVDRLIWKRLGLRSYRRWSQQLRALRTAQREPTHWGIDERSPVARILLRIEPGDAGLAIGPGCERYAYLLAAHDMAVTFLAGNLAAVERVETRVAGEALGNNFAAFVAQPGYWPPELDHPIQLVVLDAAALDGLTLSIRRKIVFELQERTEECGLHVILPNENSLAPEAFLSLYPGWTREEPGSTRRRDQQRPTLGVMISKPSRAFDTPENVSKAPTHARGS